MPAISVRSLVLDFLPLYESWRYRPYEIFCQKMLHQRHHILVFFDVAIAWNYIDSLKP
ncbi:hypothetical protein NIES22_59770 [Calothrix brevissima NIES-22]|nr:hypothetical protein NIES22_59770 [Calothrix brevissima NIES-22]